jgi:OOP family OmpA-OmpF porin
MLRDLSRLPLVLLVAVSFLGSIANSAIAQSNAADQFFAQDWRLNPKTSRIYMQSVKKNALFETHKFTVVEGTIGQDGAALVKIELASINTGVDLRDVRMRFLLFETFKFPFAEISTKLDKTDLQSLLTTTRMPLDLTFKINLHGIEKDIKTRVMVTRIVDNAVSVATIKPIIVKASDFGLAPGIAKLTEAVGGILIAPAASITFDLVFEGANYKPELKVATAKAAERRAQEKSASISSDACKTRLDVISKTRAIYFGVSSAALEQKSEPLLDSVAQIFSRCPSASAEVSGHTDSDGRATFNQDLSEQRAQSVAGYLFKKGIAKDRIKTIGYGDKRPVAANNTSTNKAKNRRIEFRIITTNGG